jgi:siroheme synthase-like protein
MAIDGPSYPVNLVLAGRRVLVVGGRRIAARKAQGLVDAGARVHVIALEVGPEMEELAARHDVVIEQRGYEPGDVEGYWLAVEATGDPAVAARVAADGEGAHVWVNAADQPEQCSVTLPAVVRQGALTVTFSTGGASPAVASWLRARAEHEYGPEYAELIDIVGEAREEWRRQGRSSEALDWRTLLDSGILDDVRSGRTTQAKERLQAWLSSSSE